MCFISSKRYESIEEEKTRLSKSPVRSINYRLSQLPVNYKGLIHKGLVVSMPFNENMVVVVKDIISGGTQKEGVTLNNEEYSAIIVASDNRAYPVGGTDISVSASEIRRGKVLNMKQAFVTPF